MSISTDHIFPDSDYCGVVVGGVNCGGRDDVIGSVFNAGSSGLESGVLI